MSKTKKVVNKTKIAANEQIVIYHPLRQNSIHFIIYNGYEVINTNYKPDGKD